MKQGDCVYVAHGRSSDGLAFRFGRVFSVTPQGYLVLHTNNQKLGWSRDELRRASRLAVLWERFKWRR